MKKNLKRLDGKPMHLNLTSKLRADLRSYCRDKGIDSESELVRHSIAKFIYADYQDETLKLQGLKKTQEQLTELKDMINILFSYLIIMHKNMLAYHQELAPQITDAAFDSANNRHDKVFNVFQGSLKNDPPFFERLLHKYYSEIQKIMGKIEDELERQERQMENLLCDLEKLIPFFETNTVTDIFIYSAGNVEVKDFVKGTYDTDIILSVAERTRIINSLASVADIPIDKWVRPTLEGIIPKYNIRTTAILPPWTMYPEITFRKPADKIFTLENYVQEDRLSHELYDKIVDHIKKRSNIIVSGSTGSGKTTFTNACLQKMQELAPNERWYIVEDTPEIQTSNKKATQLYIRKDQAVDAVQTSLRWTPKRIIFGELRSAPVVVELLDSAWLSGHPGNITTIHADSAAATIPRIEGLLRQVILGQLPDFSKIIHLIVHLSFKPDFGPVVNEALTVKEIQEENKMS